MISVVQAASAHAQYWFSELRGTRVAWAGSGDVAGRCGDIVVTVSADTIVVRLLVVRDSGGRRSWLLPWEDVVGIDGRRILVSSPGADHTIAAAGELPLRIGRDVVGRSVVDRERERVGVVRDVAFVLDAGRLRPMGLDLSLAASIVRRIRIPALGKSRLIPLSVLGPASLLQTRSALELRVLRGEL